MQQQIIPLYTAETFWCKAALELLEAKSNLPPMLISKPNKFLIFQNGF